MSIQDRNRYHEEHEASETLAEEAGEDALCAKCGGTRTVRIDVGFGRTEEVECDACAEKFRKPNRRHKILPMKGDET